MAKQQAAAMEKIGERIRQLCAERGISHNEADRRAGLSVGHTSQIIAGKKKPCGRTLVKLSKVLGVGILTSRRTHIERRLRTVSARQAAA
jgi:transcriptional regulator with XRE-family HTH domain